MYEDLPAIADPQTYAVIGVGMRVHTGLGSGFPESVYQEACALELTASGIPFAQQLPISVWYNGRRLSTSYRPDFLCFDALLVEIKALQRLGGAEVAQALCYLKAMRLSRALLLNFGAARLEYRRLVRTPDAMP